MIVKYRPEIDGLRAIAVGAVILYHAQITIFGHQPFKGGFIGVDIFFVISGYLITSIILKELVTTGIFSFKKFYERRIRRILPVLLFVMLISLPIAWIILMPNSFIDFSKSILYSLGFSSNFYFHYSDQEYGAVSGLLKPFLHTWSLSVEEQFYILFPIVLSITFKYFRKYLIHILILVFFISLGLVEWGSINHPSLSFYILPTRLWELLAGSILAYFEITKGKKSENKTLNLILPTIGMFLIVHFIIFFNNKIVHPSFYTLSPIIGVCLIIWFSNKEELITKILSTKLFVGIGLISYSLYIWHYSIFAFSRQIYFFDGTIIKKLYIGLAILILSILTWYFIEQPARNKSNKFKVVLSIILISISILVIVNVNIVQKDGYKDRMPKILQNNLSEPIWDLLKNSEGEKCYGNIEVCKFNTSSNKKVYIIGDSHIGSLMYNLKDRVVNKNYQFITYAMGSCLFFPEFTLVNAKTMEFTKRCNNFYFQQIKEVLSRDINSIVIFGGRLPLYISNYHFNNQETEIEEKEWERKYAPVGKYDTIQISFQNEISELSKNHKIILIYPIPEVGWNPNKKIHIQSIKKKFDKNFNLENFSTSYQVYQNRAKSSFKLLDSIQGNNVYRVYPHTLFCDTTIKDRCVTHDENNIFYHDEDHPSLKGAEMINDLIMEEIEKIKFKSN